MATWKSPLMILSPTFHMFDRISLRNYCPLKSTSPNPLVLLPPRTVKHGWPKRIPSKAAGFVVALFREFLALALWPITWTNSGRQTLTIFACCPCSAVGPPAGGGWGAFDNKVCFYVCKEPPLTDTALWAKGELSTAGGRWPIFCSFRSNCA